VVIEGVDENLTADDYVLSCTAAPNEISAGRPFGADNHRSGKPSFKCFWKALVASADLFGGPQ
jgi:hypothetical protein